MKPKSVPELTNFISIINLLSNIVRAMFMYEAYLLFLI
jgi:hypothetical protein